MGSRLWHGNRAATGSTHPVIYAIRSAAHLSNAARCAVYGATDAGSPRRQIRAVCWWRARGDQRQNNATRHSGPKKKSVACEMFICEAASALDHFGVLGWCLLLSHSCLSRPCYAAPRVVTLFTCPLSAVYSVRVQIVSHALLIAHRSCRATSAG